jgi:hypothetical protein
VGGGFGVARAVDVDAVLPPIAAGAHVGRRAPAGEDLPERAGRLVAQRGVGAAGEDGGHCCGERRRWSVAHGVHPAVKEVKAPDAAAIRNRVAVQSCGEQLRDRDHSMLRNGDFGDQKLGCAEFVGTIAMNFVHPVYVRTEGLLTAAPRAPRHKAGDRRH